MYYLYYLVLYYSLDLCAVYYDHFDALTQLQLAHNDYTLSVLSN